VTEQGLASGPTPRRTPDVATSGTLRDRAWQLLSLALLLVVVTPRFNGADKGVQAMTGTPGDADEYVRLVHHYRGVLDAMPTAPFSYRPLTPWLAAQLPMTAMTALNVVNVAWLGVGLWWLDGLLAHLGRDARQRRLGGLLYAVSFPTFYYGSIGYVDPAVVALAVGGAASILTARWWLLAAVVATGAMTKETIAILLPVLATHLWLSPQSAPVPWRRRVALLVSIVAVYLTVSYACRQLAVPDKPYVWSPSWLGLMRNLPRVRAWISAALGFGAPGVLCTWVAWRWSRDPAARQRFVEHAALFAGVATSLGLFALAMVSAYADGRPLWLGYAFAIPIAVQVVPIATAPEPPSDAG
jgi:hypothetical protein